MRAPRKPISWTPAEDAILKSMYKGIRKRGGWERLLARLPGKERGGCKRRARKLGLHVRRKWRAEEDRLILSSWADGAVTTMSSKLSRTWNSISGRAKRLGLSTRWQGFITVNAAAKRLGYPRETAKRIFQKVGVPMFPRASSVGGPKGNHLMVDWDVAREGVLKWESWETILQAAERLNVSDVTVERWVRKEKLQLGKGVRLRMAPEKYDALKEKYSWAAWYARKKALAA